VATPDDAATHDASSSQPGSRPVGFGAALAAGPVVLDGGLATELETRGYDLSGHLWSAKVLAHDPQAVVDAHVAYYRAGAQVATTKAGI
jgi:S-methylmethionine-dependent homocysteine/selenocysteine methylase